jgi:HPt (histidine-containing phosphotransfer) domain-containing protein
MSANAEMLAFFERQRESYGRRLPERFANIDRLWLSLAHGGGDSDRDALEREAHSLAGSSGTFGWPQLGAAARQLELAVSLGDEHAISAAMAILRREFEIHDD